MKAINFTNQSETFYKHLNEFISQGTTPLLDLAYPNHDGNLDADAIGNLMLLRDRLNSIINGCNIAINHINEVINL